MDEIENVLNCPACQNKIKLITNYFQCSSCNLKFPTEDKIGILVPSPSEHIAMIQQKIEGVTGDWYSGDQLKSYQNGPYYHHLQKRQKYVSEILKKICIKGKAKNLLDLGCGDGSNLVWLSEFSENLWGTDYNLLRLKRAKKNLEQSNIKSKLFLTNIFSMPFNENLFDIIFFNHVIEHLKNDKEALEKIYKITKPGGTVIIGTPNEGAFAWRFAYFMEPNVKEITDHVNFYTENSIRKISEDAGFTVKNVKHMGWGIPIWKLDPLFRRHKFLEDIFEIIGKKLFKKQATSLYIILEKSDDFNNKN